MGCQGASSPFTDLSHHWVSNRTLTTTMAISPWQESVSPEPAGLQPEQMGQIRDSCRIFRPQSVPHQGRWLWMPHFTKLLFPLCLYPGYPIHRAAAWHHPHHLALSTLLCRCHHCPTTLESGSPFDVPITLPGETLSSTSSTCAWRCVLERPYSTHFRHYTGPGTSSNTGCGTRAIVTPASVTTPMLWKSAAKMFWTWDRPMGTTSSPSTYVSI